MKQPRADVFAVMMIVGFKEIASRLHRGDSVVSVYEYAKSMVLEAEDWRAKCGKDNWDVPDAGKEKERT